MFLQKSQIIFKQSTLLVALCLILFHANIAVADINIGGTHGNNPYNLDTSLIDNLILYPEDDDGDEGVVNINSDAALSGIINGSENGVGIVNVNEDYSNTATFFGTEDNSLNKLNISANKILTLLNDTYVETINLADANSILGINEAGPNNNGIIDTIINFNTLEKANGGILGIRNNHIFNNNVNNSTDKLINLFKEENDEVQIATNRTLTFAESAELNKVTLFDNSALTTTSDTDSALTLSFAINANADNIGTLQINTDTTVLGNIGELNKALNTINIADEKELTLKNTSYINTINIGNANTNEAATLILENSLNTQTVTLNNDSTLTTQGAQTIIINGNNIITETNNTGIINVNANQTTFNIQIGAAGNALKEINIISNINTNVLFLTNDTFSQNINLNNADTILSIGENGANSNAIIDTIFNYDTLNMNSGGLRIGSNHTYNNNIANSADKLINDFKTNNNIQIATDTTLTIATDTIEFSNIELLDNSTLVIATAGTANIIGNIGAESDGVGTLQINNDTIISGIIGHLSINIGYPTVVISLNTVNIADGKHLSITPLADSIAMINNLNIGNDSILTVDKILLGFPDAESLEINLGNNSILNMNNVSSAANITNIADNNGTINITSQHYPLYYNSLRGNIGAATNRLNEINLEGNLILSHANNVDANVYVNDININPNNSSLAIQGLNSNKIQLRGGINFDDTTKQPLIFSVNGDVQYQNGITQSQALIGMINGDGQIVVKDNLLLLKFIDLNDLDTVGDSINISDIHLGNSSNISITNDSILKKYVVSDAINGDVTVTFQSSKSIETEKLSNSANQIGNILTKRNFSSMNSRQAALFEVLQDLNQEEFNQALENLIPDNVINLQKNSLIAAKSGLTNIKKRLSFLRSLTRPFKGPNLFSNINNRAYNYQNYQDLYKARDYNYYSTIYNKLQNSRSFWGEVFGQSITGKKQNNLLDFEAKNYGFTLGYDRILDVNWTFGAAYTFATNKSKTNSEEVDAKDHLNIDSHNIDIYTMYKNQNFFNELSAGFSLHNYDQRRSINFGNYNKTAYAEYQGFSYNFNNTLGYDIILNEAEEKSIRPFYDRRKRIWATPSQFILTPKFSLFYSKFTSDDYNEKRADSANLQINSNSKDILQGEANITFAHNSLVGTNSSFLKEISFATSYDFINTTSEITANFVDDPNNQFTIITTKPEPLTYHAGIGFTFNKNNYYNFGLQYNYSFNDEIKSHFIKANMSLEF